MMYIFQRMVLDVWDMWCNLFSPIPYGEPYVATFALIALGAMTVKKLVGGQAQ